MELHELCTCFKENFQFDTEQKTILASHNHNYCMAENMKSRSQRPILNVKSRINTVTDKVKTKKSVLNWRRSVKFGSCLNNSRQKEDGNPNKNLTAGSSELGDGASLKFSKKKKILTLLF